MTVAEGPVKWRINNTAGEQQFLNAAKLPSISRGWAFCCATPIGFLVIKLHFEFAGKVYLPHRLLPAGLPHLLCKQEAIGLYLFGAMIVDDIIYQIPYPRLYSTYGPSIRVIMRAGEPQFSSGNINPATNNGMNTNAKLFMCDFINQGRTNNGLRLVACPLSYLKFMIPGDGFASQRLISNFTSPLP